jgi:TPR repeat protein
MFPWDELGLEPTGDATLIRRAYAIRLKRTRPEDDPAGFTRLRAAYEAALRLAEQIATKAAAAVQADKPEPEGEDGNDQGDAPNPGHELIRLAAKRRGPADEKPGDRSGGDEREADHALVREIAARKPEADRPDDDDETADHELARLAAARRRPAPEERATGEQDLGLLGDDHDLARRVAARRRAANEQQETSGPKDEKSEPLPNRPDPSKAAAQADRSLMQLPPGAQGAIRDIGAALDRKANSEAARLLIDACKQHLLPFRNEFQIKDRLAVALLVDQEIPIAQLRSIAEELGWYDRTVVPRRNSPEARICDRIDTETTAALAREAAERERTTAERARLAAASAKPASFGDLLRVLGFFALFLIAMSLVGRIVGPLPAPPPSKASSYLAKQPIALPRLDKTDPVKPNPLTMPLPFPTLPELRPTPLPTGSQTRFDMLRHKAQAGDVETMRQVGDLYASGDGTRVDLDKAAAWRLEAARAGNASAMAAYGLMALRGQGTVANMAEAYRWLSLAQQRGWPVDSADLAQATRAVPAQRRASIDREIGAWHPEAPHPPLIDAF